MSASAGQQAARNERMVVAYDLALWRAAELALAAGYPTFAVSDSQTDATVADYSSGNGPWGSVGGFGSGGGIGMGLGLGIPLGAPDRRMDVSARASFVTHFQPANTPGNYNAQFAIEQTRRKYGKMLVAAR